MILAAALAALISCQATPGSDAPLQDGATGMFRGESSHTGLYADSPPRAYGGLAWRAPTEGPIRSTPVVAGSCVFVGSGDGHLYAFDRNSGVLRWRFRATTSVTGSPAVSAGVVYFTDHASTLYALSAGSGELLWSVESGPPVPFPWGFESGDIYASSPALSDGIVYFGGVDGYLRAVDGRTGEVVWLAATGGRIRSTPAVADGLVHVGSADGRVYAFEARTGRPAWSYETEGAGLASGEFGFDRRTIQSSPAVNGDRVYVGARDGFLYALSASSGQLEWRFDHEVSWVNSSPAIGESLVVVGTSDGQFVQGVDAETGAEMWRTATRGIVWTSPLIVGSRVVVAENLGRISVLDLRTGERIWSAWVGGRLFGSPVIHRGTVYVGSMDGALYALRTDGPEGGLSRAVFWDSATAPAGWYAGGEELRNYLAERDYGILDAQALHAFMEARIADGRPSSIVFALDHAPESTVAGGRASLLRRYLDAGGSVVWPSLAPLLWRGDPATGETGGLSAIDRERAGELLGVDFSAANFDPLGARATDEGAALGLPRAWLSRWSVAADDRLTPLAIDEFGDLAAWRRFYGGPPGSGFTRLWGASSPEFDPAIAMVAAEWRPRAGATGPPPAP